MLLGFLYDFEAMEHETKYFLSVGRTPCSVSRHQIAYLVGKSSRGDTYRFWTMQHPHVEVPKEESSILSNASKTVVSVITSPRVERDSRNP